MKRAWAGVTAEKEISGIHHHFQEFKNSFMLNEIREMLIQYSIITQRKVNTTEGAVVVTQLEEFSLLTQDVCGSNPVNRKLLYGTFLF